MTSAQNGEGGSESSTRTSKAILILQTERGEGGQTIQKLCGRHIWKPPDNLRSHGNFFARSNRGIKQNGVRPGSSQLPIITSSEESEGGQTSIASFTESLKRS